MMKNMRIDKTWIWGLLAILALGGVVWWSQNRTPGITDQPKIGGLFALTGYASFAGEASRDGFLMAIEDSGFDVDYVVEDFQSDTKTLATASSKLINVDQVPVIIGPEWAEFGEVIVPTATERKVLFISPWMVSEGKNWDSNYYFSATPSERGHIRKILDHMKTQGVKSIALLYSNNGWSFGHVDVLKDELKKTDIKIAGEFRVNEGVADFRTEISRINGLKADALYTAISTDNDEGVFDKQLKELGVDLPHYMPYARAESNVFLSQFGQYAKGIIYPASSEYKNMDAFREKYKERFGKEPGALSAATAYDMTTLVLRAIKDGARTSDDIRQYLLSVKDYDGYSNKITFNKNRQVAEEKVILKRITGSAPEIVAE